jgi:hypothetical protein
VTPAAKKKKNHFTLVWSPPQQVELAYGYVLQTLDQIAGSHYNDSYEMCGKQTLG